MNKSRKTSNLYNVVTYDESGNIVLPAGLTLGTAPASSDNSSKAASTAWIRTYVAGQSYATSASVTSAIAALVDTAPTTLDTLNELAAALGDDPNFATTVTASIGTKVPQARTITINGTAYDLSADRSWTIAAGLTSFNTRTGAITLTSGDVTGALGFTPYNATNPTGYITGITSGMVTTALGYTPYNASNPSGYITASALTPYLPLAGGTMTGKTLAPSFADDVYGGAIEIRERSYASNTQSAWSFSPAITFHWGNRAAIRFGLRGDGLMAVDDAPIALRSWVTAQNYITGYTETDTLASVTARGASTSTLITLNNNLYFGNSGTTKRGIQGTVGVNDMWFVGGGATAENAGFLEISTGDDGQGAGSSEPIYVRQYGPGDPLTGTLFRSATLLDASGNTSFPGTVTAGGSSRFGNLLIGQGTYGNSIQPINDTNMNLSTPSGAVYVSNTLYINGGNIALHAGNYSSYAVPLSGGTMTGTLSFSQPVGLGFANGQYIKDNGGGGLIINSGAAININGTSVTVNGNAVWNQGNLTNLNQLSNGPGYVTSGSNVAGLNLQSIGTASVNVNNGSTAVYRNENGNGGNLSYAPVLHLGGSDTMWQIQGDYYNSTDLRWRAGYAGTWYAWRQILHSANYQNYALPLTGGTVSGVTDFGADSGSDRGIGIRYGNENGGYGRIRFYQSNSNHMTIHAFSNSWQGGGLGTGNSAGGINIAGSNGVTFGGWNSCDAFIATGGAAWFRGDVTAFSDARLKEDVLEIDNAVEKITSIRGVTFTRNDKNDGKRYAGVIAQEVLSVLPEVVTEDEKGMYSVAYGNMAGLFIEAIKEQQSEIEELKDLVKQLLAK